MKRGKKKKGSFHYTFHTMPTYNTYCMYIEALYFPKGGIDFYRPKKNRVVLAELVHQILRKIGSRVG